jgi:hypothetical protein
MSSNNFYYNEYDRFEGESRTEAESRQRDYHQAVQIHENGLKQKTQASPYLHDIPTTITENYNEPVKFSWLATYIGAPLLIFALLIWLEFLPFGEVEVMGYPLVAILFVAGLFCVASRFFISLAGVGLMLFGGVMGLGTLLAIIGGATVMSLIGNIVLTLLAFLVGGFLASR